MRDPHGGWDPRLTPRELRYVEQQLRLKRSFNRAVLIACLGPVLIAASALGYAVVTGVISGAALVAGLVGGACVCGLVAKIARGLLQVTIGPLQEVEGVLSHRVLGSGRTREEATFLGTTRVAFPPGCLDALDEGRRYRARVLRMDRDLLVVSLHGQSLDLEVDPVPRFELWGVGFFVFLFAFVAFALAL